MLEYLDIFQTDSKVQLEKNFDQFFQLTQTEINNKKIAGIKVSLTFIFYPKSYVKIVVTQSFWRIPEFASKCI